MNRWLWRLLLLTSSGCAITALTLTILTPLMSMDDQAATTLGAAMSAFAALGQVVLIVRPVLAADRFDDALARHLEEEVSTQVRGSADHWEGQLQTLTDHTELQNVSQDDVLRLLSSTLRTKSILLIGPDQNVTDQLARALSRQLAQSSSTPVIIEAYLLQTLGWDISAALAATLGLKPGEFPRRVRKSITLVVINYSRVGAAGDTELMRKLEVWKSSHVACNYIVSASNLARPIMSANLDQVAVLSLATRIGGQAVIFRNYAELVGPGSRRELLRRIADRCERDFEFASLCCSASNVEMIRSMSNGALRELEESGSVSDVKTILQRQLARSLHAQLATHSDTKNVERSAAAFGRRLQDLSRRSPDSWMTPSQLVATLYGPRSAWLVALFAGGSIWKWAVITGGMLSVLYLILFLGDGISSVNLLMAGAGFYVALAATFLMVVVITFGFARISWFSVIGLTRFQFAIDALAFTGALAFLLSWRETEIGVVRATAAVLTGTCIYAALRRYGTLAELFQDFLDQRLLGVLFGGSALIWATLSSPIFAIPYAAAVTWTATHMNRSTRSRVCSLVIVCATGTLMLLAADVAPTVAGNYPNPQTILKWNLENLVVLIAFTSLIISWCRPPYSIPRLERMIVGLTPLVCMLSAVHVQRVPEWLMLAREQYVVAVTYRMPEQLLLAFQRVSIAFLLAAFVLLTSIIHVTSLLQESISCFFSAVFLAVLVGHAWTGVAALALALAVVDSPNRRALLMDRSLKSLFTRRQRVLPLQLTFTGGALTFLGIAIARDSSPIIEFSAAYFESLAIWLAFSLYVILAIRRKARQLVERSRIWNQEFAWSIPAAAIYAAAIVRDAGLESGLQLGIHAGAFVLGVRILVHRYGEMPGLAPFAVALAWLFAVPLQSGGMVAWLAMFVALGGFVAPTRRLLQRPSRSALISWLALSSVSLLDASNPLSLSGINPIVLPFVLVLTSPVVLFSIRHEIDEGAVRAVEYATRQTQNVGAVAAAALGVATVGIFGAVFYYFGLKPSMESVSASERPSILVLIAVLPFGLIPMLLLAAWTRSASTVLSHFSIEGFPIRGNPSKFDRTFRDLVEYEVLERRGPFVRIRPGVVGALFDSHQTREPTG